MIVTTESIGFSGNDAIQRNLNIVTNPFLAPEGDRKNGLLSSRSLQGNSRGCQPVTTRPASPEEVRASSSSSVRSSVVSAGSNPGVQNVSILDRRYLLIEPSSPSGSSPGWKPGGSASRSPVVRTYGRCIKLDTKEQFVCKVVERNEEGTKLLAAYHRLDEGCEEISLIHEVILSSRFFYLIMPATYGNVHSYLLAKKRIGEPEAANILRQMILAVQFCHSKGIVLRDLKMGKFVFHDKERTLVRLDTLEDAVLLTDLNDDGLNDKHGCPNYVSPEKADILRSANKKYPGKATDMWGLGVMLYAMLVGRYPFQDDDHSRLFNKIRNGRVSIPETVVSPHGRFLIRCLLHKNPSKRPTCGELLNHSWLQQTGKSAPRSNSRSSSRRNGNVLQSVLPPVRSNSSDSFVNQSASSTVSGPRNEQQTSQDSSCKGFVVPVNMEEDQVVPNLD